jgi:hypothetical protein
MDAEVYADRSYVFSKVIVRRVPLSAQTSAEYVPCALAPPAEVRT